MNMLGGIFKFAGWIIGVGCGLLGFFLSLGIISKVAGFWGIVAALILGPVTFVAAPLYAGFSWGDWFPFLLNYGGGIAAFILISIGTAISDG